MFSFTGPSFGTAGVGSTDFTVALTGSLTGSAVLTPSDGGSGGSFDPTTIELSNATSSDTFIYTPSVKTLASISISNDRNFDNPAPLPYLTYKPEDGLAYTIMDPWYTFTGPVSGTVDVASSNFTITPNAPYVGTITITYSGGGLDSSTTKTWNGTNEAQTFTITPTAQGTVLLIPSSSRHLPNPNILQYVSKSTSSATSYGISAPATATVGDTVPVVITPDGSYTGTITLRICGGGVTQDNVQTWSSSSAAHTINLVPTVPGPILIYTMLGDAPYGGAGGALTDARPIKLFVNLPETANSYTVTGPFSGLSGATSTEFTVTPNAPLTGIITITPTSGYGLSAITREWTGTQEPKTFTITPTVAGVITLTMTNDADMSNPTALTYGSQTLREIDNTWLTNNGPEPYCLGLEGPNYYYKLMQNVTVLETGFALVDDYITLDLNGYTLTYDTHVAPGVANGGFETGSGSTIPNWDVTGASGAQIVLASSSDWPLGGWWDNKILQIQGVTSGTTKTIVSDTITLPVADIEYCAMIQPKIYAYGIPGATCTLEVLDANTGDVIPFNDYGQSAGYGDGTSVDAKRGALCFNQFIPSVTSVKLRVKATPVGATGTIMLDHADLVTSRQAGIIAVPATDALHINHKSWTTINNRAEYYTCSYSTIKNGTVIQGSGRGWGGKLYGAPIYANGAIGLIIDNVNIVGSGGGIEFIVADTCQKYVSITNCTMVGNGDIIDDRSHSFGAISCVSTEPTKKTTIFITDNTMTGFSQNGIVGGGMGLVYGAVLRNDVRIGGPYTDSYSIGFGGANGFEIANNTVIPSNGRGLYFGAVDSLNGCGFVHDNYIQAIETTNLEYGQDGLEVTGLRIRSGAQHNMIFYNNLFSGYTDVGLDWASVGARVCIKSGSYNPRTIDNNYNSGLQFLSNTFKAIVLGRDPGLAPTSYDNQAWGFATSRMDTNGWPLLQRNVFASNITPFTLGDNDSGDGIDVDIMLLDNEYRMITDEGVAPDLTGTNLRTFTSISVGPSSCYPSDVLMYGNRYTNGAPASATFFSYPTDIEYGWLLDLTVVDSGNNPVAGASVTITDDNGSGVVQFNGIADSNGQCLAIKLISTKYFTDSGSTNVGGLYYIPSSVSYNNFSVHAAYGALTDTQSVLMDQNKSITLTIQ